jgi:hypothetical protein
MFIEDHLPGDFKVWTVSTHQVLASPFRPVSIRRFPSLEKRTSRLNLPPTSSRESSA